MTSPVAAPLQVLIYTSAITVILQKLGRCRKVY